VLNRILSRARFLRPPRGPVDLLAPDADAGLPANLPGAVLRLTGSIAETFQPDQGVCNLVLGLDAERGRFILKIARGAYRGGELAAEHAAMQALHGGAVPVPAPLLFLRQGEFSYHLREYVEGSPAGDLLESAAGSDRLLYIEGMGRMLAAIHNQTIAAYTWAHWLDGCLDAAANNLRAGVLDPDEFPDDPPGSLLGWLKAHRPVAGPITLLHGDYRPKNLLWRDGRIASVLDWAFVDAGDPVYDLAIALYYMRDEDEERDFLRAYAPGTIDPERVHYFERLGRFLNV
jgi:aminoglycoside phosphotransferase (APT) family kinase protein